MPSTALQSIESRELAVDERDGALGLDPRTHLAVLVAVSIAALAIVSFLPLVALEVLAMLYLNGHARLAFQCGLSFAIAWGLSLIPLPVNRPRHRKREHRYPMRESDGYSR